MKTIFFIGYLMLLVALAKCNGKETKTICISDNMNDCIFEEVKSKRDISTFLNSIHPSFMKKMDRLSDKKECTTKMCLINNLFKLANRQVYRKGSDSLTCVGDPYSNHGIKCVPIEGLFIGK